MTRALGGIIYIYEVNDFDYGPFPASGGNPYHIVVLGRDMLSLSLAIGISFSPSMARLIRSKILSIREQMFVEAA